MNKTQTEWTDATRREVSAAGAPPCAACSGTGWELRSDGVVRCRCWAERVLLRRARDAHMPPNAGRMTFDAFAAYSPAQVSALSLARKVAVGESRHLGLVGNVGTGKTHLGCAILHEFLRTGRSARYCIAADLISEIRATWAADAEVTEKQAIARFVSPDCLFVDEVGVQAGTDSEERVLFRVLDQRYQREKAIVLASNESIEGLRRYLGDRIMDRLRDGNGAVALTEWESARGKEMGGRNNSS